MTLSRLLEKNIKSKILPSLSYLISSHFILSHLTHLFFGFYSEYLPELARAQAARETNLAAKKVQHIDRMLEDLAVDMSANPAAFANDRWDPDAQEEEGDAENGDDDDESNVIDRSTFFL